ncbi:MAG: molybdopterin-dependent oxidoreductase [Lamprocystis purpurea]|jgi:formate dehydrogenase major subunit|uniref:molybdopterin oxidoreductase family protein n=1 Tax=Lamprocystis purpurea TaxID=61598 RepID=UPI0003A4F7EB|nr:molybdopterin-dependent oxidoreductase [Lamprocystis purpurea]MBV5274888.1 molybdopterin-dependent oxidoreductase [Lamprocystis purpurea]
MNYQACVCNLCGTGCGQFLKTDGKRVLGVAPIVSHPVSKGKLCVRGWHANELLNTNERITTPLIRENGRLREASLDEALSLVVRRLGECNGAADEIGLLASARSSNEDGFALRRLAREVFKTHLLGVGAEAGHRNSMDSLSHAFGYPGAVGDLTRIDKADYILIVGTDIARQNPIIGGNLHAAQRRGARLVSLSSSRTQMAKLSTKHFQQQPGTKALVLNALAKALHALRTVNHARHADIDRLAGYTQYVNALRTISSVALEKASGIRYEEIEEEAQILDAARSVVILFPSGISGLDKRTIEAICNLAVLTDRMDDAQSALIPVAGISNLQGSFDMGLSGESGHSVFGSLADPDSPLRALFVVDHDDGIIRNRERIAALELVVYCGAFRNPFMDLADVVFPLTAYNESDGTYTCADRRVQLTRKNTDTPGAGLPGWRLYQAIAEQAGHTWGWRDAAEVFLAIADTIPSYHDLTHHRLAKGFGIHWDITAFAAAGQMKFHEVQIDYPKSPTCEEFPFALMVGKGRHFWHQNNLMRKTLIPRREYDQTLLLYPQGYVEICPDDAQKLKVKDKWLVHLTSSTGTSMKIAVKVSPDVQPGTAYIPYFIKNMISDFLIRYDNAFAAGEESIIPVRIEEK